MTDSPLLDSWSWASTSHTIKYRTDMTTPPSGYESVDGVTARTSPAVGSAYDNTPVALSSTDSATLRDAMNLWQRYVPVHLNTTSASSPDVVFRKDGVVETLDDSGTTWHTTYGFIQTYPTGSVLVHADGVFQADQFAGALGTNEFDTLFHELGHVLALKDGVEIGANSVYTSRENTVMAYDWRETTHEGLYPLTPMIYDLQALHQRYGETDYNDGPNLYGRSAINGLPSLFTLWDAGGNDTINFSWISNGVAGAIDLRGGVDDSGNARLSHIGESNFAIGFDVVGNTSMSGVVDIENVIGGSGDDEILGGFVGNTLNGMGGDDTIVGYSGGDLLMGGEGDDILWDFWWDSRMGARPTGVAPDDDIMFGGKGNDTIEGQDGFNILVGDEGNDIIYLYTGTIGGGLAVGGAGEDQIWGGGAQDRIFGNDDTEHDELHGGGGNDVVYGGETDWLFGDADEDTIGSNDTLYVKGIAGESGPYGANYDAVGFGDGGLGNDTIIGDDSWFYGYGGNDKIIVNSGENLVAAGSGENTIIVNPGAHVKWVDLSSSSLAHLQIGTQAISGEFNAIYLAEGVAGLNLGGGYVMIGTNYEDEDASQILIYKMLDDDHRLEIDQTATKINIEYSSTIDDAYVFDLPKLGITYARESNGLPHYGDGKFTTVTKYVYDALSDASSSSPESKTGTSGADYIQSGSAADTISAGAGDDVIHSHAAADSITAGDGDDVVQSDDLNDTVGGADTVSGGNGDDFIQAGEGNDSVNAGAGQDIVEGGGGQDLLQAYAGLDSLAGGAGTDSLYGGDDADTLDGGAGADYLYGGAGADRFVFATIADSSNTGSQYDRISDYEDGVDTIDLSGTSFYALTTATQTASGQLRMYLNGDSSRTYVKSDQSDFIFSINGNHLADLTDDDFVFGGLAPEFAYGTTGADTLTALAAGQRLYGLAGNDTLAGAAGHDILDGGVGSDRLTGGAGADIFRFSALTHSCSGLRSSATVREIEAFSCSQ